MTRGEIDNLLPSWMDKQIANLGFLSANFTANGDDSTKSNDLTQKSDILCAIQNDSIMPTPSKPSAESIAEALQSLSLEERGKVYHDIHGFQMPSGLSVTQSHGEISRSPSETDEFQHQKLQEMEQQVRNFKSGSSWSLQLAAIEMAECQNIQYVQHSRFRLKFLRTDDWDAAKAARRLIQYFDWKLELFGETKLVKDITLDDLKPEDIKMLKKGHSQKLPARDRAGRMVVCFIFNGQVYHSPESMARQIFFFSGNHDDETDRNGVVMVSFKIATCKFATPTSPAASLSFQRVGSCLPIRWCAMHKFLEPGTPQISRMDMLVDAAVHLFTPGLQARIRVHHGSYTEWMYKIMSFGIPHNLIPLTADYKIKTKNHLEWLSMRQTLDEWDLSTRHRTIHMTDLPSNIDILLGKGKPIQESCGNLRLVALVDDYVEQYQRSSKSDKTSLAAQMVQKVKSSGGHFLSKGSGVWIPVSDDMARDKVSHMFRHQRHNKGNRSVQERKGNHSTIRVHHDLDVGGSSVVAIQINANNKRIKI